MSTEADMTFRKMVDVHRKKQIDYLTKHYPLGSIVGFRRGRSYLEGEVERYSFDHEGLDVIVEKKKSTDRWGREIGTHYRVTVHPAHTRVTVLERSGA